MSSYNNFEQKKGSRQKMRDASGAIVLAGGQSRRMGQDKALLPYNGMTLLEHVVATVFSVVTEVVVVMDVPNRYTLPRGRMVVDTFPDAGPVGGILTGLTILGEGSHLVVACDMPGLKINVLQFLLKVTTSEWDAVVPQINKQMHPLCAVYRHTAAPKLLRFLETDGRAATDALGVLQTKIVGEGVLRRLDPQALNFTNVNTPEDLTEYSFLQQLYDGV